jgi:chemotaxis protein histidine kinase CheA
MNRSILIVICDFLLISLLVFSTLDINKVRNNGAPRAPQQAAISTNRADGDKDLAAVMRLALDDERKNRDQLIGELTRVRSSVAERDTQVQSFQHELQAREQESQRLQQQRSVLEQQFTAAQSNIQTLNQQVQSVSADSVLSREKLAAMEAEARKQSEQAAALQQQLHQLTQSNQTILAEKQQLAGQLQVAEVERRHATEQAAQMQEQVKVEREEKAKLTEGVKSLAARSGELAQEVRENRPVGANTIFNEFLANRVEARFSASKPGWLGGLARQTETKTALVTDGTNTFAMCHVQDTPLDLSGPATDWEKLTGSLGRHTSPIPLNIDSLSFSSADPRVVLIPISKAQAAELGSKPYKLSADPYKFQNAVLVGASEGYYGECRFEIDPTAPTYVKLDRNVLKGLFGKFNPSRGDLVFSETGELLGVMANSTYCVMLRNLSTSATVKFGQDVRAEKTGDTISRLYTSLSNLPLKLQ